MFTYQNARLTSQKKLTKEDFLAICQEINVTAGTAQKKPSPVAMLRIATKTEKIVTINTKDGSIQAQSTAQMGDAILTRLTTEGALLYGVTGQLDQWVVKKENIDNLYTIMKDLPSSEHGQVVSGKNVVQFIYLPNGGEIVAPWGGTQQTSDGVLQYSQTTDSVYLNEMSGFKTFDIIQEPINPA